MEREREREREREIEREREREREGERNRVRDISSRISSFAEESNSKFEMCSWISSANSGTLENKRPGQKYRNRHGSRDR